MSNHPRPYHRVTIGAELLRSESVALKRCRNACAKLGLGRVTIRHLVLLGIRAQLEMLRGECVRRGIDYEELLRESGEKSPVVDEPPVRMDGFSDDPSV